MVPAVGGGALSDTAIRPSVCPRWPRRSAPVAVGLGQVRHRLQVAQVTADCGFVRART